MIGFFTRMFLSDKGKLQHRKKEIDKLMIELNVEYETACIKRRFAIVRALNDLDYELQDIHAKLVVA